MNRKRLALISVSLILGLIVIGLIVTGRASPTSVQTGPSAPNGPQAVKPNYTPSPDEPHVFFLEPLDGDSVPTSANIQFGVSHLDLKNKRVYLIVDRACAAPGGTITTDAQHLLFEGNSANLSIDLNAGPHRLCLQVADNKGVALDGPGMLEVIDVTSE